MEQLLEEVIFAGVLKPIAVSSAARANLLSTFPDGIVFKNEWYLLYSLVHTHPRLNFTPEFLQLYCRQHKGYLQATANINMADFAVGDSDAFMTFVDTCVAALNKCTALTVSEEEYSMAIETFRLRYVEDASIKLLEQGAEIVTNGVSVSSKRTLQGFSDMTAHVVNGLSKLSNMMDKKNRKGVIVYDADYSEEEKKKLNKICTYGIKTIDDALGGIYETDMISLLAPPKGGKSRLSAYIFHNALISGASCVSWSIENGVSGFEALVRARHFDYYYNSNERDMQRRKTIDADQIRKGTLEPEMKALEEASWADLRNNPAYGRWANIDEDFDADTFLSVLENAVNMVNAKLVLVDYLQLVSGDSRMPKHERIGQCYQRALQFLQSKSIAGIFPAQIKQEAVKLLGTKSNDELENVELRDAGGETAEVIRTPSVLMLLYADAQSIRSNEMNIVSIPSRNAAPFKTVRLHTMFETCSFYDVTNIDEQDE